jgi:hypothetical protein
MSDPQPGSPQSSRDVLAPTSAYMFEADLTKTGEHGADWTKACWLNPL